MTCAGLNRARHFRTRLSGTYRKTGAERGTVKTASLTDLYLKGHNEPLPLSCALPGAPAPVLPALSVAMPLFANDVCGAGQPQSDQIAQADRDDDPETASGNGGIVGRDCRHRRGDCAGNWWWIRPAAPA